MPGELEEKVLSFIENYENNVVLFSGGKDSLCALVYIHELAQSIERERTVKALYANTTAEFPENERYVEEMCDKLNIPLISVKPKLNYFTLAKKWGIPSPRFRWCCRELKIKPMAEYLKSLESRVVYDGIRHEESRKRARYNPIWWHPGFKCWSVSPIITWKEEEVEEFLRIRSLPLNPIYSKGFSSCSCWCGVYKRVEEFERLLIHYPDFFEELLRIEDSRKGIAYIFRKGKKIYLRELREKLKNGSKDQS
jgi:3'-phosphoadenosine 5'-phosphosulfate sulfotransferase (PAPS reductase)/FAD synthetase